MNILIVANHYAVCSARYMTDAFRRLGHEVRHVGPAMGRNIWGLTLPPGYEWTPDVLMATGKVHSDYEPEMIEQGVEVFHPDLQIVMDSDPAILDAQIRTPEDVPLIVYGVDNHVRDYRRPWFDQYFLAHRHVSVMEFIEYVRRDGEELYWPKQAPMTHLPCAYDPTLHTPSPIAWADREYDVCCLGVLYPRRVELVKALKAAGYKVLFGTGLVGEKYVQAHQNSRIALCASFNGDVAQRVFESAAMGCVVLSDNCSDFKLLKPEGFYLLNGWLALTPENAVAAVRDILSNPDAAQENIAKSLAWVKPHSWDERARAIVEWYFRYTGEQLDHWRPPLERCVLTPITSDDITDTTPKAQATVSGEVWGAVNAESGPDDTLPPVDTLGSTLANDDTLTSQEGDE